jgi:hypothetical protein
MCVASLGMGVVQVYVLTGQKRDTPAETDSSYKFYTSLRKQRPNSEMAEVWCMEHGVLTAEVSDRGSAAGPPDFQ